MNKGSRILLAVALVLGLLLIITASAVLYIGLTDSGTRWALERVRSSVNSAPGSTLAWRVAEGTLLSGLEVRDFRFASESESGPLAVTIQYLSFSWQPLGLLKKAVVIDPLQIEGLAYEADGTAQEKPPMTEDEFRALLFNLPVSVELQNVSVRNFSFRSNESTFVIDSLSGSAALDGDELQLNGLRVEQEASVITGSLMLDDALAAEADITWQTRLAERDFSGELKIAGDLQQLQLDHVLTRPLQLNSSGTLVPGFLAGPPLGLDLRHTFDTLDMAAFGQEGIVLQQGDVVTAGSPESLSITGTLQGQIREFEPLTLALDVRYQPESITFNAIDLNSAQVAINASGSFQLSPRSLEVDWTLTHLDPGAALPNVRLADVTGTGSVTMNGEPGSEQLSLMLTGIEGSHNELPLNIAGEAEVIDAQLSALELQASSGNNMFSVSGTADGALALDWQLQAPQLQQLWQGLSGELAGQGTVTGQIATPAINGRLDGSGISLAQGDSEIFVESLRLEAAASTENNDIALTIGSVSMQGGSDASVSTAILERASLKLTGTPAQHDLNADLALADTDVTFEIDGAMDAGNWQGQLQTSSVRGDYGNWQQEEGVAISYVNSALTVEQGCWNYGVMRLCMEAAKPAASGLSAELELLNIPLAWLDYERSDPGLALTPVPQALQQLQDANGYTLPAGLNAEGDIDVRIAVVNFAEGTWDSLDVAVVPENVVLQVEFADDGADDPTAVERFGFDADTIHVVSTAGVWSAELQLGVVRQTASGDAFQGDLSAQIDMAANEELDGELTFNFEELGWIGTLTPVVSAPYGTFNGSLAIGGTKSAPAFDGQVQLANAGFAIPEYGLAVTEITLTLQTLDNNEFLLEGTANSGEGTLALRTTLSNLASEDRAIMAELTGTDFSVINTAYARADLSPQLQVAFVDRELTVTGGIILPLLDLDLEEIFATAGPGGVEVSRDVVVINATPDAAVASDPQSVPIPLYADVSLLLGEDVRLRGYGLDTRLSGELSLEQSPNRPMLVYGELGIPEGSFEMYNQMLRVENGRLMFFGNPANPVVDIRAFRETNDAEVGMLLSGNIKNMQGDLYSSPDLPDDEILALLITGKSFNNVGEQDSNALLGAIANFGLGRSEGLTNKVSSKLGFDSLTVEGGETLEDSALGLGKYITPDLLLQYKVGLFDNQSALSINYNLTEHIKLEVETGISQSVDISYTIETD